MSGSKCYRIRHVVCLKQIVRKWRKIASSRKASLGLLSCKVFARLRGSSSEGRKDSNPRHAVPGDVPAGHLAVYVGKHFRRFVIRTAYLNYPVFRTLLEEAEKEFGFNYGGGIAIPCDEQLFEQILRLFGRNDVSFLKHLNLEELQSILCANEDRRHCSSQAMLFEKDSTPLLSVN